MRHLTPRRYITRNKDHVDENRNNNSCDNLQQHVSTITITPPRPTQGIATPVVQKQQQQQQQQVPINGISRSISRSRSAREKDTSVSLSSSSFCTFSCFNCTMRRSVSTSSSNNSSNSRHQLEFNGLNVNGHHTTTTIHQPNKFKNNNTNTNFRSCRKLVSFIMICGIGLYVFQQYSIYTNLDNQIFTAIQFDIFNMNLYQQQQQQQQQQQEGQYDEQHNQRRLDTGPPIVTIFYNLYIPPESNKNGVTNALGVIHEQIRQIGLSDLFLNHPDDGDQILLYYNSIGNYIPISSPSSPSNNNNNNNQNNNDNIRYKNLIEQWCFESHPKLRCIHLKHYNDADESVTLQSIYDYCSNSDIDGEDDNDITNIDNNSIYNQEYDNHRVVYLHSKGSFHPSKSNNAWRRALTAAALHEDCIDPPQDIVLLPPGHEQYDTCNLCGLTFYTQFTMFVPGNMWTASCSYVRQLLPPRGGIDDNSSTTSTTSINNNNNNSTVGSSSIHELRREEAVTEFLLERSRGRMAATLIYDRADFYGLDRYASEHWIGSHPALIPCDVDPVGDLYRIILSKRSRYHTFASVLDIADQRYQYRHEHRRRQRQKHILSQQPKTSILPKRTQHKTYKNDENDNNTDDDEFEYDDETNKRLIERIRKKRDRNIIRRIVAIIHRTLRNIERKLHNHDRHHVNIDEYGFRYQLGPRHPGNVLNWNATPYYMSMIDPDHRHREFYLLPGNLLKWSKLYPNVALPDTTLPVVNQSSTFSSSYESLIEIESNQRATVRALTNANNTRQQFGVLESSPFKSSIISHSSSTVSSSWIWNWFPDGEYWRQGVIKHGIKNVISKVNFPYTFHLGIPDNLVSTVASAFYDSNDDVLSMTFDTNATTSLETAVAPRLVVSRNLPMSTLSDDTTLSEKYVVFYHITFYSSHNKSQNEDSLQLIANQIHIIATSFAAKDAMNENQQLAVFYTLTLPPPSNSSNIEKRGNVDESIQQFCSRYPSIACRLLNVYHQDYEGETLSEMYEFCSASDRTSSPTSDDDFLTVHTKHQKKTSVIYVNNQGPIQLRQDPNNIAKLRNLILHTTMAVFDKRCIQMQDENGRTKATDPSSNCNVCGLKFYTIWTLFFPGNMFTTTCSYVQKLLSPQDYEYQMNNVVVGKILLASVRSVLVTKFLPSLINRPDYLGLDRYSIDHWIGSHPTIRPCDLTDKSLEYWWDQETKAYFKGNNMKRIYTTKDIASFYNYHKRLVASTQLFDWSLAPRSNQQYNSSSNISVPTLLGASINQTMASFVKVEATLRYREYHLLAGNVLKWSLLYNETTTAAINNDSWIWTWFPDGREWKDAIDTYGIQDAVQQVTSPYVTKD